MTKPITQADKNKLNLHLLHAAEINTAELIPLF